ncbi:MAG: 2-oxoacid:acceptor oxidoreductase subunit alpha [Candidatus Bathyarchaeia archaeon]
MTDVSFKIGGEAGQGLQAIGYSLAKAFAKGGLHVFANQDNESRIRGGHNFFQIRVSDRPVQAVSDKIHVLVSLDKASVEAHQGELVEDGVILIDAGSLGAPAGRSFVDIPFDKIAKEETGLGIAANSVAAGAALSVVGYDLALLEEVLEEAFKRKGSEVVEKNIRAAQAGYRYVLRNLCRGFRYMVEAGERPRGRLLLTGNEAVAAAALISGCRFMSGYPMSPSTPIQQFFAARMGEYPVVFEQAEDEIAAINMALGASFAGARSMVATSGGGFSLMVEGLSLAGMTESPIVIVLAQRPGPATGFPTRTEQAELEFAIHAGHGEFPRAVFAPGTPEQAFHLTFKAFNLAERYQIPVIILSDQHLADSYYTVERFETSHLSVDRGGLLAEWDPDARGEYRRHEATQSGVSPRLIPGAKGGLVVTDSDEHTEDGHITERADVRSRNVEKRMKVLELVRREISPPVLYGPADAEAVLVGWGSTYGALREAVDSLNRESGRAAMLHFSEVWPFPTEAAAGLLGSGKRLVAVEGNAQGQMARLIRAETGVKIPYRVLRYDGRPLTPGYILEKVRALGELGW